MPLGGHQAPPDLIGGRRPSRLSRRERLQMDLQAAEAYHRNTIPAADQLSQWGLSLRTPFGKVAAPGMRSRAAPTRSVSASSLTSSPNRLAPLEFNRSALPATIQSCAAMSKPRPLPPARPKEVMKQEAPLTGSYYPFPLGRYTFTTRGSKCYTREN